MIRLCWRGYLFWHFLELRWLPFCGLIFFFFVALVVGKGKSEIRLSSANVAFFFYLSKYARSTLTVLCVSHPLSYGQGPFTFSCLVPLHCLDSFTVFCDSVFDISPWVLSCRWTQAIHTFYYLSHNRGLGFNPVCHYFFSSN